MQQTVAPDQIDVLFGALLLIRRVCLGAGVFARFGRQSSMLEVDGDHAGRSVGALAHGRRELQDAQTAHEVHVEGRAQGITLVTGAINLAPGFAQE